MANKLTKRCSTSVTMKEKPNQDRTFVYHSSKDFLVDHMQCWQERGGGRWTLREAGGSVNWSSLWGKIYQKKEYASHLTQRLHSW